MNNLLKKISKNKEKIGICGLGYVGLPLAINFTKKNIQVFGFDVDNSKIKLIKKNKSYLSHITSKEIKQAKKKDFMRQMIFHLSKI